MSAILIISNCLMMPRCYQLNVSKAMSKLSESVKKKTLKPTSRSNLYTVGLLCITLQIACVATRLTSYHIQQMLPFSVYVHK